MLEVGGTLPAGSAIVPDTDRQTDRQTLDLLEAPLLLIRNRLERQSDGEDRRLRV